MKNEMSQRFPSALSLHFLNGKKKGEGELRILKSSSPGVLNTRRLSAICAKLPCLTTGSYGRMPNNDENASLSEQSSERFFFKITVQNARADSPSWYTLCEC